ncbi:hypothetical protein AOZ07_03370 [Glutamicibacter halophytocola]|uniref:hypothetical protein n=1 Tax=Glutamicibacter halophytocola TaxID=1933880 RepID=UPI0006D4BAEB|nr:hypothetical protein [Glutamicibacter halophytocola]ALG28129.1 hypothetical protein AOZ07_03370 [Glutamicibacter halophytocola]
MTELRNTEAIRKHINELEGIKAKRQTELADHAAKSERLALAVTTKEQREGADEHGLALAAQSAIKQINNQMANLQAELVYALARDLKAEAVEAVKGKPDFETRAKAIAAKAFAEMEELKAEDDAYNEAIDSTARKAQQFEKTHDIAPLAAAGLAGQADHLGARVSIDGATHRAMWAGETAKILSRYIDKVDLELAVKASDAKYEEQMRQRIAEAAQVAAEAPAVSMWAQPTEADLEAAKAEREREEREIITRSAMSLVAA